MANITNDIRWHTRTQISNTNQGALDWHWLSNRYFNGLFKKKIFYQIYF